jgi:hypothetical protein
MPPVGRALIGVYVAARQTLTGSSEMKATSFSSFEIGGPLQGRATPARSAD